MHQPPLSADEISEIVQGIAKAIYLSDEVWGSEISSTQESQEKRDIGSTQCENLQWITGLDLITGRFVRIPARCRNWRNKACMGCFNYRKKEFKDRIRAAIAYGSVYYLPIDDKRVAGIKREIGRDNYFQLPADMLCGGYFFYDARGREKIGTQILSTLDIPEAVWDLLTNTPEGMRPSGNLGKSGLTLCQEHDDEDSQLVTITGIMTPSDSENTALRGKATRIAEQKTADLNPHTYCELKAAIRRRTRAFVYELNRLGVPILARTKVTQWVDIRNVNWCSCTECK
jgi:hypothetical protein